MMSNLRVSGRYWNIHLQKGLSKMKDTKGPGINITFNTNGNRYTPRRCRTSVIDQSQHAFPVAQAVNFPAFRNLSFSPTTRCFVTRTK